MDPKGRASEDSSSGPRALTRQKSKLVCNSPPPQKGKEYEYSDCDDEPTSPEKRSPTHGRAKKTGPLFDLNISLGRESVIPEQLKVKKLSHSLMVVDPSHDMIYQDKKKRDVPHIYSDDPAEAKPKDVPADLEAGYKRLVKQCKIMAKPPKFAIPTSSFYEILETHIGISDRMVIDNILKCFDRAKRGRVDPFDLTTTLMSFVKSNTEAHLRMIYNIYDLDSDGQVSKMELLKVWSALYPDTSRQEIMLDVHGLFQEVDTNHDNWMDFGEFREFAKKNKVLLEIAKTIINGVSG